jgi:serine/threonine protein kinase
VSEAVVHLHRMGIAHRDIKPENVLCTDKQPHKQGHIKLCDFGFAAEFVEDESHSASVFTQLIGTPEYLAPEMVGALLKRREGKEAQGYTFKVDYWALGCLVYELPWLTAAEESPVS